MINSGLNTVLDMDMDILAKQEQWKRTSIARNVISFFRIKECFEYHRLNQIPTMQQRQKRQNRNFKSVCESRYKCELCQKVVWQLGGKKT